MFIRTSNIPVGSDKAKHWNTLLTIFCNLRRCHPMDWVIGECISIVTVAIIRSPHHQQSREHPGQGHRHRSSSHRHRSRPSCGRSLRASSPPPPAWRGSRCRSCHRGRSHRRAAQVRCRWTGSRWCGRSCRHGTIGSGGSQEKEKIYLASDNILSGATIRWRIKSAAL